MHDPFVTVCLLNIACSPVYTMGPLKSLDGATAGAF